MNPEFWSGRNVFVTGHTGFKGSWLTLYLHTLGAGVFGYALDPPEGGIFDRGALTRYCRRDSRDDVGRIGPLVNSLESSEAQIVIHMAAQPLVGASYLAPADTIMTNVMGTINLLEAIRLVPSVAAVVIVTSDKVYRNENRACGYTEADALGGQDPYSASKASVELITQSYASSFPRSGLAIATARAGNVIGGGDVSPQRLMPDLVRAFEAEVPAALRSPDAIRPWQHVLDPLSGYLALAEGLCQGQSRGAWNFGPSMREALTVGQLADIAADCWGQGAHWYSVDGPGRFPEEHQLLLDSSKSMEHLDWQPMLSGRQAVQWTIEWQRRVMMGESVAEVTETQIREYLARSGVSRSASTRARPKATDGTP